jgi:hypothetical protein
MGDEPGGIKKSAVTADGDDEVGLIGDFGLGDALDQFRGSVEGIALRQKGADPAFPQMRKEGQCGLGNARVAESAY